MKPRFALLFSLSVNLVLAGAIFFVVSKRPVAADPKSVSKAVTNKWARLQRKAVAVPPPTIEVAQAFHWSEIESEDYRIYLANLRAVGCPENTARDILVADVNDFFQHRVNDVVSSVQNRFWEFMVDKKLFEKVVEAKGKELDGLENQREAVLKELFGTDKPGAKFAEEQSAAEYRESRKQFYGFLPEAKAEQSLVLEEKYNRLREAIPQDGLKGKERQEKLKALEREHRAELQQALSPQEFEEYKLRTSHFAQTQNNLIGFDASADELRSLTRLQVKAEEENTAAARSQAQEETKKLLGDERYAAYQRAQDGRYQEAYRVTQRYQLPVETAEKIFDIRTLAEQQAKQLRANKTLPDEQRAEMLDGIRAETERAMTETFGPDAFKSYRKVSGNWVTRLNQSAPKQK